MGTKITIKQNDFSHGMQSDTRNKNLVGQTEVFGASKLKHFDIYDKGNLKPISSFERFNTDDEINYGINVVGGKEGSTVYGLGKGLSNWYAPQYINRIRLNADSTTNNGDYIAVDLSQLSNNFWDNVNTDGSDVKITPVSDQDPIKTIVVDFDSVAKTGWAIANSNKIEDIYIYFGNADAEASVGYEDLFESTTSDFWTFDNTLINSAGSFDMDGNPVYGTSVIGTGVTTSTNIQTDVDNIGIGNEMSIGFFFEASSLPVSESVFLDFGDQGSSIHLKPDGTIRFYIKLDDAGSPNFIDQTSVNTITAGSRNYISITCDKVDGLKVYINGDSWFTYAYANDLDGDNGKLLFQGLSQTLHYGFVSWLRLSAKSDTTMVAEGKMLTDATFWSEQSLETFDASTVTTSGIGIYIKDINDTLWSMAEFDGILIKDLNTTVFPVPAFINKDQGYYFLTSSNADSTGVIRGGRAGFGTTLIEPDIIPLESKFSGELMNTYQQAADKEYYISQSGALDVYAPITKEYTYADLNNLDVAVVYDVGFNGGVYDSFPKLSSLAKYNLGLAMTGTRNGRGSIEIWDLLNLDPETVVDTGTGLNKVIANIKGSLVTVVDNYLQSPELSRGKPTLDFRLWQGGDNMKQLQSFSFDNVDTVYPNNWEYAIDNKRSDLHNASVFVGEPATDWKGMWAIGSGDTGTLAVSILYDTETLGRIDTHHSIGNNLIVIKNDGAMFKLNDDGDYNQTSVFESMVFDGAVSGREKTISAMEIVLDKELPAEQVITLEYSVDGKAFETVGTCTDKVTEFTLANGGGFNTFNEVKLKISSTGGDAVVNEWSVRAEYTDEVV